MASVSKVSKIAVCVAAAFSAVLASPLPLMAQEAATTAPAAAPLQEGQLQQLVAPIALYPDSLLSQVLMASTYPLEVVEAARWQKEHANLQGPELEAALADQSWDPSVKSLIAFPNVLTMMSDRISWTSQLGDAFLSQQQPLMDQVQVLRGRAQAAGNLQSNQQQTVTTSAAPAGDPPVISIAPAQPDVVYVPVYNPTVVYGPWPYPAYTPFYWYPPGFIDTGFALSFGLGLFVGNALWGGYNWHTHNVYVTNVYRYNNFNHTHFSHVDWRFDPAHRHDVGYGPGARGWPGGPGGAYGRDAAARNAARESFRARADAGRQDLRNVDSNTLRQRGGGGYEGFGNRGGAGGNAGGPGGNRGGGAQFRGNQFRGGNEGGARGPTANASGGANETQRGGAAGYQGHGPGSAGGATPQARPSFQGNPGGGGREAFGGDRQNFGGGGGARPGFGGGGHAPAGGGGGHSSFLGGGGGAHFGGGGGGGGGGGHHGRG